MIFCCLCKKPAGAFPPIDLLPNPSHLKPQIHIAALLFFTAVDTSTDRLPTTSISEPSGCFAAPLSWPAARGLQQRHGSKIIRTAWAEDPFIDNAQHHRSAWHRLRSSGTAAKIQYLCIFHVFTERIYRLYSQYNWFVSLPILLFIGCIISSFFRPWLCA